jgi:spermidine synthase
VLAVAVLAPPLAFIEVPDGGRVLSYREGAMAAVSVVEDAEGVARLRINNRQQEGSSATLLTDSRQALLPLLLHPQPRRALFLGLGTGVTASSAAEDPTLRVDVAELLPEVIEASAHFTQGFAAGSPNPRLHAVAADARRFVRVASVRYDVIVSDNFHPARSGSGALYTVEHFQAVRDRLADEGLFCQWLPLHQLDLDTLRLAGTALPQHLADFGLADEWALFGGFVAGPQSLARWSAGAALNTDDRPVVAYRAPRITYAPDSLPRDRLKALLGHVGIAPTDLLGADGDPAGRQRLAAYWSARDDFIAIGQQVRPSDDVRQLLVQVRDPLLSVLRTSPDFRPAYDPLLRMAGALGRSDPVAARRLLSDLALTQPARPEAGEMLRTISTAP